MKSCRWPVDFFVISEARGFVDVICVNANIGVTITYNKSPQKAAERSQDDGSDWTLQTNHSHYLSSIGVRVDRHRFRHGPSAFIARRNTKDRDQKLWMLKIVAFLFSDNNDKDKLMQQTNFVGELPFSYPFLLIISIRVFFTAL